MSSNSISTYKFKPFQFTVLRNDCDPPQGSIFRFGYELVCNNNAYLLSFRTFVVQTNDAPGQRVMRQIWKYSLDLGEWKVVNCKNVPQKLVTSYKIVTLSGNIIIIYGGKGVPSGGICSNRMYLGNLANEYKENGMSFVDLEESGDVPLPLYGLGVIMDGKYIYSIGNTSGYKHEMDVHRFDLRTRKWELLYKSLGEDEDPKPRHQRKVVFSKGRIYIIGRKICDADNFIYFDFKKIHMFDLDTKQWQLLSTKHDDRLSEPGYPKNRCFHSCVQCPEKSNLVYLCGGLGECQTFNDVWRIDIDTMQWEKLTNCIMPYPVYLHSTAVTTPSGRMCCFGGIVTEHSDLDAANRSYDMTSAWITIPKLKVICWEAMIHYFKEQMFKSSDECLKKIGIPQEFYERIIEARRIC